MQTDGGEAKIGVAEVRLTEEVLSAQFIEAKLLLATLFELND